MSKKTNKTTNRSRARQARVRSAMTRNIPRSITPKHPPVSKAMVHKVCGLVDPFCEHARGAKYPDDSSVRSLPYTRHGRYQLAPKVSGTGTNSYLFFPQYSYQPLTESTSGTTTVNGWALFGNASAIAGAQQFRIVSSGFILRRVSAPLNSSGIVHLRTFSSLRPLQAVDTTTYNSDSSLDIPLQDCTELAVALKHTSQMPQTFYSLTDETDLVGDAPSFGFSPVVISFTGAPDGVVLDLEYFVHFEVLFGDTTDVAQMATPAPRPTLR